MTLPLGPIYWVNPHKYYYISCARRESEIIIRLARETRIYLSLKCSPHSKKRPRMYLLSTQLAQSSPSQASFNINTMYYIIINPRRACAQRGTVVVCVCVCVCVRACVRARARACACACVCVPTHNCRLTHWNHKTEIPTGSQQYSDRFKFCRFP